MTKNKVIRTNRVAQELSVPQDGELDDLPLFNPAAVPDLDPELAVGGVEPKIIQTTMINQNKIFIVKYRKDA